MAEYALLGKRIPKPDAVNRVTGRMVYADDMTLPGALAGKILGSPVAHGRIRRLDVSKAAQIPCVGELIQIYNIVRGPLQQDADEVAADKATAACNEDGLHAIHSKRSCCRPRGALEALRPWAKGSGC